MESNIELKSLVCQLIAQYGGGIIFLAGMEGSGKSDLLEALVAAAPDKVAPIFFSEALATHLTELEGHFGRKAAAKGDNDLKTWVTQARALMAQRKKNIHPHLITGALYSATRGAVGKLPPGGSPGRLLVVDGFPRDERQPGMVTNIFLEFFADQPAMLVEAYCPREVALQRALLRGKPTDTVPLLTAAHDEYESVITTKVLPAMTQFADHLEVAAGTTREAKMDNFIRVLSAHCENLHQHGFATVAGTRKVTDHSGSVQPAVIHGSFTRSLDSSATASA